MRGEVWGLIPRMRMKTFGAKVIIVQYYAMASFGVKNCVFLLLLFFSANKVLWVLCR